MEQRTEEKFYEYDPVKRALARKYERTKLVLEVISETFLPATLSFAFLAISISLRSYLFSVTDSYWLTVLSFLLLFTTILHIAETPVGFYSGYVVDHRFGLSKQTPRDWLVDELKQIGVQTVFLVPLGLVLYYLILSTELWWLAASVLLASFSILLSVIVPYVVMPIFYKVTPLTDEGLRSELLEMSRRAGAKNIHRVLVADESRRSVRANAMFSGIGSTRAIILFDTLLNNFTKREIKTVVAHELGHYVNKDIWISAAITGLAAIPPFLFADVALNWAETSFGLQGVWDPAGFPLLFGILIVVGFLLQPASNALSRIIEGKADSFALRVADDPEAQASSEKRLADMSLSVDSPSLLVETFFYTHPPSSRRVRLAEEWKNRRPSTKAPTTSSGTRSTA